MRNHEGRRPRGNRPVDENCVHGWQKKKVRARNNGKGNRESEREGGGKEKSRKNMPLKLSSWGGGESTLDKPWGGGLRGATSTICIGRNRGGGGSEN